MTTVTRPTAKERDAAATPLMCPTVVSAHLLEHTVRTVSATVTLSTYYDGQARCTRSVLVANANPAEAHHPGKAVAAFVLSERRGHPDTAAAFAQHHHHLGLVADVLAGRYAESHPSTDLIRSVLEAGAYCEG